MTQTPPLHPVVAKVRRIEAELNRYLIGRGEELHGTLLALAARQHVFLLSPPGAGKSLMATEICRRIRGAGFFKIELNAYTMRDELFGPISLAALRERDALERKYHGFLPDAYIAQLDEIWKCPPATLNTLLTLLNEREFRNDERVLRAPLVSAIVTSNETPPTDRSLDGLYDRILLRFSVSPLKDPVERKRASEFSITMRAFEAEARRVADSLTAAREAKLVADLAALKENHLQPPSLLAGMEEDIRAQHAAAALGLPRPDRWLIDAYGELFSTTEARQAYGDGQVPVIVLPPPGDRAELLRRMMDWTEEHDLLLPYETFLDFGDLETLHGLVLAVRLPETVEAAFYRILDSLPGASVRRETELRTLIAAEAVLAGRNTVSVDDLRVMIPALWDRPEMLPDVRATVEKETGNLERELKVLHATIDTWREQAREPATTSAQLDFRHQMDQELARFALLAEAYPDHPDVVATIEEAQAFRDEYNAKLFSFEDEVQS